MERSFERGREALLKEADVIEIFKSRRYTNAALKHLIDKETRMKLKEHTRYLVINPEKQEESQKKGKTDDSDFTDGFHTS